MRAEAPTLRPYQRDSLDAIASAREAGRTRVLVKKPTGTGKTVMFAELLKWPAIASWLATFPSNERRMMVIAHREEILDQSVAKIQAANPGLVVMVEQGPRVASRYADVVVASIQTLQASNYARLKRINQWMKIRLVVVDEAHHAAAKSYRDVLSLLGFLPASRLSGDRLTDDYTDLTDMESHLGEWDAVCPKDRLLVGVTATPNRSDAIGLSCVFQDLVYSYALRQAIADGWLVPPVPFMLETTTSLDDVKMTAGDFNQKQLGFTVNTHERNLTAVKGWQEHGEDQSTLCFTVDVEHAHALAKLFQQAGVAALALHKDTPKEDRRLMLRQYTEGSVKMITNCMVLTEGTDLPRTGCILHAKPTKSATLYEQMTGRGLRLFPGKDKCIVLDIADIARKHSLQTAPTLYGLPPGLKADGEKTLEELATELDTFRDAFPNLDQMSVRFTLEDLRVRATYLDPWKVQDLGEFGKVSSLDWTRTSNGYRLDYPWQEGRETIEVRRDLLGKWEIVCTMRPSDGGAPRQRVLSHGCETELAAASLATSFINNQRGNIATMQDRGAAWKLDHATEKQMALLMRMRIQFDRATLTKGQAGRLIGMRGGRR